MAIWVTDTHPLIWYTSGKHSKLSQRARRVFDAAFEDRALIVIPAAVFWEISLLIEHERIKVREAFGVRPLVSYFPNHRLFRKPNPARKIGKRVV